MEVFQHFLVLASQVGSQLSKSIHASLEQCAESVHISCCRRSQGDGVIGQVNAVIHLRPELSDGVVQIADARKLSRPFAPHTPNLVQHVHH